MITHLGLDNIDSLNIFKNRIITFIPYDNGSRIPGAKLAPTMIYQHLLNNNAINSFKNFDKCFTLPILTNNSALTYNNIENWFNKIFLQKNFPIAIGGDHSISLPIVNSYSKQLGEKINVLIFDAHHDFDKSPTLKNWNVIHELSKVCKKVIILGCRNYPDNIVPPNVKFITMDEFDLNSFNINNSIAEFISPDVPLYLSIDLDVLEPSEFPGVSYPVPGGLTFRELKRLLRYIFTTYRIPVADIVEFNPMIEQESSLVLIEQLLKIFDSEWKTCIG